MAFSTKYAFSVGDEVEAVYNLAGYRRAIIKRIITDPRYEVEFTEPAYTGTAEKNEDQIRNRTMTIEQAWEKVAVLCGIRDSLKQDTWTGEWEFDRETRHQCYQVLGKAHVKITPEVKERVRGLIQLADDTEY